VIDFGVVWAVLSRPATLAVLAVTCALAWPLGRRRGRLGVLFVLTLGVVLAATAPNWLFRPGLSGLPPFLREFADPAYLFGGFGGNLERLANIGLFLPLALLASLLWRRPLLVIGSCAGLSFLLEAWQSVIGRGGDAVDVVHNTTGAVLGAGLAYLASQGTV
jgi:glycopeptide antibiotics resistance protein